MAKKIVPGFVYPRINEDGSISLTEKSKVAQLGSDGKILPEQLPTIGGNVVLSVTPENSYKVINVYVNSLTGKFIVEYDTSSGSGSVISNPPIGHYKVYNLYVDSQTGRLSIEYET